MGVPIRRTAILAPAEPSVPAPVSTYREQAAPPALARVVACTWEGRAGRPRWLRVVPDGGTDLSWDGHALRVARLLPGPVRHHVDAGSGQVGIRLRPGWAAALLRTPVGRLPPVVDLADVWGPGAVRPIEELLAAAADAAARRALLAELVRDGLTGGDGGGGAGGAGGIDVVDRRVVAAAHRLARPDATVPAAAGAVGLSVRQLRRLFDDHVGVGPKTLQVIARFQRFMACAATAPPRWPTAAHAAADCGYTDQSHLARDCRRLAGTTPATLLTAAADGTG